MNVKVVESTENKLWLEKEFRCLNKNEDNSFILSITDKLEREFYGFGSCANELGIKALRNLSNDNQEKILMDLFSESGDQYFKYCRLPIGANDYAENWYSYNETDDDYEMVNFSIERDKKYIIPYIKDILKINPEIIFCASPWSPPTWMKTHKVHNSGYIRDEHEIYEAYALYLVKYVQAYEKEGIHIHQIHVQNEWVSNHVFPSCKWTGEQLRKFIANYLGPSFEKYNIKSEIWLGTCNAPHPRIEWKEKRTEDFDAYAGLILEDTEAYQYISGVGYQWAGRDGIQKNVESYPELQYLQTECECGDGENTWFYMQYIFNTIRHYIRNGANGFLYWNAILEIGGESTWGSNQNSMITINSKEKSFEYQYEYYLLKHFSHFTQKGANRIETKGPHTANTIAFRNPDGSTVVILSNRKDSERVLKLRYKEEVISINMNANSITTIYLED